MRETNNKKNLPLRIVTISVISLAILFIIFSTVIFIVVNLFLQDNFSRIDVQDALLENPEYSNIEREEIIFNSDNNQLKGFVFGKSNTKGLIVASHGLGGSIHSNADTMQFFVENGWAVMLYNNTGTDTSQGQSTMGLTQSLIDLDNALKFVSLDDKLKNLPIMLYGHSWGGYAVCAVANYSHPINAVVSLAGYNSAREQLAVHSQKMVGWFSNITNGYNDIIQYIKFGDNYNRTAIEGINKSSAKFMIVQGGKDNMISHTTTSIYANRDKILNQNVTYEFYENKQHNDLQIDDNNQLDINFMNKVNNFFASSI